MGRIRFLTLVAGIAAACWAVGSSGGNGQPWSIVLAGVSSPMASDVALGTDFTYQGQLTSASGGVSGTCDFQFSLWDADTGGDQLGSTETASGVSLTNGLFTATLNEAGSFGPRALTGEARWLQIGVRCPAGGGVYTTIEPRQALTAAPYAHDARLLGGRSATMLEPMNRSAPPEVSLDTGIEPPGWGPSVTAGSDGLPVISHIDCVSDPDNRLRVVHCQDPSCTTWTSHDPAPAASQGICRWNDETSIALGPDGLPLIAYGDGELAVVHCHDLACADATVSPLAQPGDNASLTIGGDGLGLIAHGRGELRVSHCSDADCSAATTTTLDAVGETPSIALGVDALGLVAYLDSAGARLKVAHCRDAACTAADIGSIDTHAVPDLHPRLVIGADGRALIAFTSTDPTPGYYIAHCHDVACTSADKAWVDTAFASTFASSITVGADGLGLAVYSDAAHNLKAAHCLDADCSAVTMWQFPATSSNLHTALTIGSDGLPFVAAGGLHVIHCASPFCTPYFRRR